MDKDQKVISLKLVMPTSSPTYPQIAQFIEAWFAQLGIKVTPSVIETNSLYDIMLPPEADTTATTTRPTTTCSSGRGMAARTRTRSCRSPCATRSARRRTASGAIRHYDKLYADQNVAPDDQARKEIMDQMQNYFYDQAPYHLLYYDDELDAYRTDRFAGWQNQPIDTGVPLLTYGTLDYSLLTDAKAAPSAAPSQAVVPAPSGSAVVRAVAGRARPVRGAVRWGRRRIGDGIVVEHDATRDRRCARHRRGRGRRPDRPPSTDGRRRGVSRSTVARR